MVYLIHKQKRPAPVLTHRCEPNHKLFYKGEKLMADHHPTDVEEIWKPVPMPEWGDAYDVSNLGRVRRIKPACGSTVGKILKPVNATKGYYQVSLGRHCNALIHRLVAEAFIGPCPPKHEVNHKNGIKTDNRIDNLEYVTSFENNKHAVDLGLRWRHRGEAHHSAKLTAKTVQAIRELLAQGVRQATIARRYGLSRSVVSRIKQGKTWKHI